MPFFPKTNEDISEFLRNRGQTSLHISGRDQDHDEGETISLSKLNHILFYEHEEMIISAQSGITLDELQKKLATKSQWIPTLVEAESSEETLGAAVARDHFHPRSLNCGALRTTILGGTFCATSGEIFKSGSRVVKSVAGYDIHRAFCGSRGRFGIILDLTLKVQPFPEMFYRFLAPLEARKQILKFHPACLEEYVGKLLVEFAGYKEDILFDIDQLKSSDIKIEELDDKKWANAVKELIRLSDKERKKILPPVTEELLSKVRKVFDPEGILI